MSIYRCGIKRLVIGALSVVCILQAGCLAPPILFPKQRIYGKIIDQHGDPVADAKLNVSWNGIRINYWMAPARDKWINTDEQGCFYFGIRKADDVSISRFHKAGYVRFEERRHSFDIDDISSSKNDPYVIYLRKIGEPTFLLSQGNKYSGSSFGYRFFVPFKLPVSAVGVDLLQWEKTLAAATGEAKEPNDEFYVDLQVVARYAPESHIFNVTFKMPESATGGFIYTNRSLFTAPADGYQKKAISFKVTLADYEYRRTKRGIKRSMSGFFYVKSRDPAIYTKMRWRLCVGQNDVDDGTLYGYPKVKGGRWCRPRLELYYHAYINPYGERNFEPDEYLVSRERRTREMNKLSIRLRKEAQEALAKGELAEKPDLIKLIEEVNAKDDAKRARNKNRR